MSPCVAHDVVSYCRVVAMPNMKLRKPRKKENHAGELSSKRHGKRPLQLCLDKFEFECEN